MTFQPYAVTNMGLSINLPIHEITGAELVCATLQCWDLADDLTIIRQIFLRYHTRKLSLKTNRSIYRRGNCHVLDGVSRLYDEGERREYTLWKMNNWTTYCNASQF